MQNPRENSIFSPLADILTFNTRNVLPPVPPSTDYLVCEAYDGDDRFNYDPLAPFDYEAFLRKEGLA